MIPNNINICVVKLQKALLISGGKVKSDLILRKVIKDLTTSKKSSGDLIRSALENVSPYFTVKSRKRGKKVTQIPVPIFGIDKRFAFSSRSIVKNSKKHKNILFSGKVVSELLDASLDQGFSKKKLQELNKIILMNRSSM
jgi:ribosomal protein S7